MTKDDRSGTRARSWIGRVTLALAACATLAGPAAAQIPTPDAHFGFRMGADRRIATGDDIERYFELVAAQSDRVNLIDLGLTTDGHRTIAGVISAPENLANLERLREINQRLSDPRTLTPDDARRLAADQKLFITIGASIHASEIGASQAANELLYSLATDTSPTTVNILTQVVLVLIPTMNPDGHRLVTDWYLRSVGTPFEGGPMPWLYHRYAGHDINRDAFMLNLAENRNLARFFNSSWHPQVFLTMHQMETNGPRFFVPPNTDPIDLNYDPLIWRSAALLGDAMALELQREGKTGVISNAKYDYYWPGFEDSAPLGHNTVCLLTEVASVDIATPLTVQASDLRAGFKGLPEYRPQINFPAPWAGGRWTLRDIVEYDLTAVRGLLFAAAAYREQLVTNFYEMGRRAVATGRAGGPYAFVIPPDQFDRLATAKLESLLLDGAIEIHRALEPFQIGRESFPEGTDVVFMAQPYRAFAKTLLERQRYPARRGAAAGSFDRPYDVAGWTLPDQMGVEVRTIDRPFDAPPTSRLTAATVAPAQVWGESKPSYWIIDARGNGGAVAVNRLATIGAAPMWTLSPIDVDGYRFDRGSIVVPHLKGAEPVIATIARDLGLRIVGRKGRLPQDVRPVGRSRVALYRPWTESIDEGWTRWVLEQHNFPFTTLTDAMVRSGDLRERFDVIVLPSAGIERLVSGFGTDTTPREYAGGLSPLGVEALKAFVTDGGRLVCLGQSATLGISAFDLPITDTARGNEERLFVPGSILRLDLDTTKPLGFGMKEKTIAFFAFSSVFNVTSDSATVETIARYGAEDLLLSGWLEGESLIAGRPAVVRSAVGAGDVVLLGFPVQHRGQSLATFRLLFNALLTGPSAVPPAPTR